MKMHIQLSQIFFESCNTLFIEEFENLRHTLVHQWNQTFTQGLNLVS